MNYKKVTNMIFLHLMHHLTCTQKQTQRYSTHINAHIYDLSTTRYLSVSNIFKYSNTWNQNEHGWRNIRRLQEWLRMSKSSLKRSSKESGNSTRAKRRIPLIVRTHFHWYVSIASPPSLSKYPSGPPFAPMFEDWHKSISGPVTERQFIIIRKI